MKFHRTHLTGSMLALVATLALQPATTNAAGLVASDGATSDYFGFSASLSGTLGLVGAYGDDIGFNFDQGSAYVFRNLNTATGTITQNVKLTASDGAAFEGFGVSASLSGTVGLVGAAGDRIGSNSYQGSAFVFRNLDTATGTITENVKLTASDGAAFDSLGYSASLSGTVGLVGAYGDNSSQGSAYVFRNLDTATGTITQNVKLIASDGAANDSLGFSASLSGTMGLVGAYTDRIGVNDAQGSAYLFRNLDTATGTITQNAKLIASDGAAYSLLGSSASLSGTVGLVGAYGDNSYQGSAYVFRNLDTATGTITQNVKLIASDGAASAYFGSSASLSGTVGLVGAYGDSVGGSYNRGAAYLFRNLDTATGTITENVKLTLSDGMAEDSFGRSVSLDGDQFIIGAYGRNSYTGEAYTGSVSSVTTLDGGNTSRTIDGLSFISQDDWVIGETTDANSVTLSAGDTANVTAAGKAVYIGKNAGSDNNTLTINGTLTANSINVGAAGNTGNTLVVNGSIGSSALTLNSGSILTGSGTVGSLTVGDGVTLSPGNSPGTMNVAGNLTWLAGGNYNWQTLNTVGTPGTEWDLISATGVLDLTALSIGSEFNINLWSLQSTGPDVNGNIANFNNTQPYQWLIATAAGGINGFTGTDQFTINTGAFNGTAGFSNPLGAGSFNISQTGNDLYLNYAPGGAPVPEPGTWAVGALLLTAAAATAWRRRTRGQAA